MDQEQKQGEVDGVKWVVSAGRVYLQPPGSAFATTAIEVHYIPAAIAALSAAVAVEGTGPRWTKKPQHGNEFVGRLFDFYSGRELETRSEGLRPQVKALLDAHRAKAAKPKREVVGYRVVDEVGDFIVPDGDGSWTWRLCRSDSSTVKRRPESVPREEAVRVMREARVFYANRKTRVFRLLRVTRKAV